MSFDYAIVGKDSNQVAVLRNENVPFPLVGVFTSKEEADKILYKNDLEDRYTVKRVKVEITLVDE